MGTRTLEARLTGRLFVLTGSALLAVGVGAVVLTDRVLDASDTARARSYAGEVLDSLGRELAEGDTPDEALTEVMAVAGEQVRLTIRPPGLPARSSRSVLPDLAPGTCASVSDDRGEPVRACAAAGRGGSVVAGIPLRPHRDAVSTLARGMLLLLVLALVALRLAVRRALRAPLAELTSLVGWTSRVVATETAVSPPPAQTREIAQLEEAFDTLVRRLLDALARERANSAHIAHELRTPLTAMIAELETLPLADEISRAAVARVRADAARLATVIDVILVLSDTHRRIRSDSVANVADIARELAPSGAAIDAPDEALVEGDERLITLAVRNLVDNAEKYGEGARLLRVTRDGERVRVSVVDGGPGLEESARERMFDRYWRGSADGEGSGLGLALVRAVAERHGGGTEARPGPGGRGLDVSFTLGRVAGWHEQPAEGQPR